MDEKTPRVYNRKIIVEEDDNRRHETDSVSNNQLKLLSKGSHLNDNAKPNTIETETSEGMVINSEMSGRFSIGRSSGWIGSSITDDFSKSSNSPHGTRNRSDAQQVLKKLQHEAISGNPSYHKSSPIARLRYGNAYDDASSSSVRYKLVNKAKSDDEMKKEKQRKWKQKMKIAQERKRQEREALDGDASKNKTGLYGKAIISCVLDNVEQTALFKQFTSCGDTADDDSIYETWSAEESSVPTSEEGREGENGIKRKRPPRGRQKLREFPNPEILSESLAQSSTVTSFDAESVKREIASLFLNETEVTKTEYEDDTTPPIGVSKVEPRATHQNTHVDPRRVISPSETEATHILSLQTSSVHSFEQLYDFQSSSMLPVQETSESRHSASTMTTRPATPSKERNFIYDFIHDLETIGESMLWHKESTVMDPATVTIHLKKGYRGIDGTFCAPRLVWTDSTNNQNYGVGLFDIQSLKKADALELGNFPYAMPGRTVCLKITNGGCFIFEARSEDDAFGFIRGIRWVVSRLTFNLVIGNVDVSCELLDLGLLESPQLSSTTSLRESNWSRAMDDVAEQLLEKTNVSPILI